MPHLSNAFMISVCISCSSMRRLNRIVNNIDKTRLTLSITEESEQILYILPSFILLRKRNVRGPLAHRSPALLPSFQIHGGTMADETNQQLEALLDEEIIPNLNEIDPTKIVWQNYSDVNDDFCSLSTCKKPIGDEKAIYLREYKTGLIAFFHVNCFKQIKK